jgi:hypothetical protein
MEHKLSKEGCECGCPHVPGLDKRAADMFLQYNEVMDAAGDLIYPKRTDTAEPYMRLKRFVDGHRTKTEKREGLALGESRNLPYPTPITDDEAKPQPWNTLKTVANGMVVCVSCGVERLGSTMCPKCFGPRT